MMTSIPKLITSGIIIALLGVVLSSPITALVFGGITETGQGVIITFLRATGLGVLPATLISSFCTEFLDKLLSCVVCYIIVKGMSNRYLSKFKLGHIYLKEKKEKNDLLMMTISQTKIRIKIRTAKSRNKKNTLTGVEIYG